MALEIERIERILKDLDKVIYSDFEQITRYKVWEGSFIDGNTKELDDENWSEYLSGSLWGGYDIKDHNIFLIFNKQRT